MAPTEFPAPDLPDGWAAPELFSVERTGRGRIVHVGSTDGPVIVIVQAIRCGRDVFDDGTHYLCGRVYGHDNECWIVEEEFAERMGGALAILVSDNLLMNDVRRAWPAT